MGLKGEDLADLLGDAGRQRLWQAVSGACAAAGRQRPDAGHRHGGVISAGRSLCVTGRHGAGKDRGPSD